MRYVFSLIFCLVCLGCGTTREKKATEQLLLSDAVDRAVANIDFSPLRGEKVYLDTQFLREIKGRGFVNANYIISSLRQQMTLGGCLVQEQFEEADFIVEARVGALGTDGHDVNYGLPANNTLTMAASLVVNNPPFAALPEISIARKADDSAAAKIAVFAYRREGRDRAWQSGLSVARSHAQARWIFGAGPFKSGNIYQGTQFAGAKLDATPLHSTQDQISTEDKLYDDYRNMYVWDENLQGKMFSPAYPPPPETGNADPSGAESTSQQGDAVEYRASQPAESAAR